MNLTNTNSLLSLMSVIYTQAQRKRVRVTLTLDVLNDFEARNIDWRKVLQLEPDECVESYIEDSEIDR
jgi:hypothetical protein|tara:strand:+ start:731 stop:934 length:204 start_codon:yes stop_codon:yes gene_type:complete